MPSGNWQCGGVRFAQFHDDGHEHFKREQVLLNAQDASIPAITEIGHIDAARQETMTWLERQNVSAVPHGRWIVAIT